MNKVLYLSTLLLILTSCSSPDGNSWLISTATDTLTVAEVGTIWNDLDESARQGFLAKDNPVGEFLTALGRKAIITEEISNDRYLYSPVIQEMKECWLASAAFIAYKDTLSVSLRAGLTEADLSNYSNLLGSVVWYSSERDGLMGPERLPDLPWELAFAFDTIATGSSVEFDGNVYTLDSIVTSDQELIDATLANEDQFNVFASTSLTESRTLRHLSTLKREVIETFTYDSIAVETYCTDRNALVGTEVLASWEGGSITAENFDAIVQFLTLGNYGNRSSSLWVLHNLRNQARLIYIANVYRALYPSDYEELKAGAESFALDQASEILFKENVTDSIIINDELILESYESMDSLPIVPESRTFESVMIPAGLLQEALVLLDDEDEDAILEFGYPGYTEYLQSGSEFLSRPVFSSELQYEMGVLLFLLEEDDTAWNRPLEIEEDLFLAYRLKEIIPPHPASFEYLQPAIRRNLTIHLEEQRTMEWLCQLEAAHQYRINSEILSKLPIEPSRWSEL